jgi:hypothetical protein
MPRFGCRLHNLNEEYAEMKKTILMVMCFGMLVLFVGLGWAAENEIPAQPAETPSVLKDTAAPPTEVQEEKPQHGFGHKLLFYLPNRILDVFDFARLRLRVGPGFAVSARATKPLSVFFGGYASVYAGLPGPRLEPTVKLPVGIENYGGISVSVADGAAGGPFSPNYSSTEIEAGFQLLIIGLDIGIDPLEVLDLATGFLFIDLRGDDL